MNYDNFTKEQIVSILKDTLEYSNKLREENEKLNKRIETILDIADKEKVLVEERWSSSREHKEFYEITFDYGFLKSILKGSE